MTTMKRVLGIAVVWLGCAICWVILGSTLLVRSDETSSMGSSSVYTLWGPPAEQQPPSAHYEDTRMVPEVRTVTDPNGSYREVTTERRETFEAPISLIASDLDVALALQHRRRGLNWYPTYTVDFDGTYEFENRSGAAREITFVFPFHEGSAVFDGFTVRDASGREVSFDTEGNRASWIAHLDAGESREYRVSFRSRGTERWVYRMAYGTARVTDLNLDLQTDFDEVDFPEGSLSPTQHTEGASGWRGTWRFDSLIANQPIGIELPTRLNPGPLAARITFFAPVGLLFFFFVVGILAMARKKDLHPMHYFFLGCSFFAFHLLFAYLVDHLPIAGSFAISAVVSLLLSVSYTRLFVGFRFAIQHVGIAQLLYLVLFSFTFMWDGFTGLAITVGAVLTLFVMMQMTGRTRWGQRSEEIVLSPQPPVEPGPEKLDTTPRAF